MLTGLWRGLGCFETTIYRLMREELESLQFILLLAYGRLRLVHSHGKVGYALSHGKFFE